MSTPAPKPTGAPPAVFAFFLFAGFWALAAFLLAAVLWQEPPATSGEGPTRLAVNSAAVLAVTMCTVGVFVCAAAGVIVGEFAKRQAGGRG